MIHSVFDQKENDSHPSDRYVIHLPSHRSWCRRHQSRVNSVAASVIFAWSRWIFSPLFLFFFFFLSPLFHPPSTLPSLFSFANLRDFFLLPLLSFYLFIYLFIYLLLLFFFLFWLGLSLLFFTCVCVCVCVGFTITKDRMTPEIPADISALDVQIGRCCIVGRSICDAHELRPVSLIFLSVCLCLSVCVCVCVNFFRSFLSFRYLNYPHYNNLTAHCWWIQWGIGFVCSRLAQPSVGNGLKL